MGPHFQSTEDNIEQTGSLDETFEKMQRLGIPADIFGNINPDWRKVMKMCFDNSKQIDSQVDKDFFQITEKIISTCDQKYGQDIQKLQDCLQQADQKIINHFHKPKELSEIMLCSFANKCLIRGNSIQFCLEEVMKEKQVINRESIKKLSEIKEYL